MIHLDLVQLGKVTCDCDIRVWSSQCKMPRNPTPYFSCIGDWEMPITLGCSHQSEIEHMATLNERTYSEVGAVQFDQSPRSGHGAVIPCAININTSSRPRLIVNLLRLCLHISAPVRKAILQGLVVHPFQSPA